MLEYNLNIFLKTVFWPKLLGCVFNTHIDPFEENSYTLFSDFYFFGGGGGARPGGAPPPPPPKTQILKGKYENIEKRLFYFSLKILLSIRIQLLDVKNKK
jgi:hypothetical protein